jgi:hypothetical protein
MSLAALCVGIDADRRRTTRTIYLSSFADMIRTYFHYSFMLYFSPDRTAQNVQLKWRVVGARQR